MNTAKTVHQLSAQATVGQIVSVNDSAKGLLHSIGLKPENHQNKTLRQVCTELKWNEEEVLEWIKQKSYFLDDKFEKVTHHFELPEHACSTYRIMMKSLEALVADVRKLNRNIVEELIQPISDKLN